MDKRDSARNRKQHLNPGEPSILDGTPLLPAATFDYEALPDEDARTAREAAAEIKRRHKKILSHALAIGEQLCAVKKILSHGQFGDWIAAEFSWSSRTAQNYMTAWEQFGDKYEMIADLPSTTVYALAAPSASAVREQVIGKWEAGERIEPAAVGEMLQKPRATAKPAKEDEPKRPLLNDRWEHCGANPEAAAELIVDLLKERLGEDFPTFVEILRSAGWELVHDKLAAHMLPSSPSDDRTRGPEGD